MGKTVKILSIDGGGIRGILPATFLSVLEERLQESSGNKNLHLSECFDVIAGTSTGGVLSCIYLTPDNDNPLVPKYTARQALEFYLGYGDSAFTPNLHGGFHKYLPAGLETGLANFFGTLKLSQLVKPCYITAYDMIHCKPCFFDSYHAKRSLEDEYYVKDVARATSALPGIFPPATVSSLNRAMHTFIDGSIVAYNPALQAYIEAKNIFPGAEDFLILSLGTGLPEKKYTAAQIKDANEKNWGCLLTDIAFSVHDDLIHYQLEAIFKDKPGSKYIRLQPSLYGLSNELDNVSNENLHTLYKAGLEFINDSEKTMVHLPDDLLRK